MGLTFTVGTPSQVFKPPFASQVEHALQTHFQFTTSSQSSAPKAYYSPEMYWHGWRELQEDASALLGEKALPHLLAMEAWQGVYLPIVILPTAVFFEEDPTPLKCASLPALIQELERYAQVKGLPTEQEALNQLWHSYYDDDDRVEDDLPIQTYAHLMLTGQIAMARQQPLWVVK